MNNKFDTIIELVFFVFKALLSIPLSIVYFGLLNNFWGLFSLFLIGLKAFKKIASNAGLSTKCIVLKIIKFTAE